ncbi:unnamed protein product [Lactuca saligna]|uniref:Uncharacterized protein n=1 Tax=Lactuca saligna TaxID=75948 RepID=A0AA35V6R5_LACSI|nr:unnamed protein product [Lactuca saligna]
MIRVDLRYAKASTPPADNLHSLLLLFSINPNPPPPLPNLPQLTSDLGSSLTVGELGLTSPHQILQRLLKFTSPSHLQKLLGVNHEVGSRFSWSLIHRSDLPPDASSMELSRRVECNSKLAVALSVNDEFFVPSLDRRSGINLPCYFLYPLS